MKRTKKKNKKNKKRKYFNYFLKEINRLRTEFDIDTTQSFPSDENLDEENHFDSDEPYDCILRNNNNRIELSFELNKNNYIIYSDKKRKNILI